MKKVAIFALVMVMISSVPAYAYPYYGYYGHDRHYRYGVDPSVAIGIGCAISVGILAVFLIGRDRAKRNQAEEGMLKSAAKANQYENYLISMRYYNSNSRHPIEPLTQEQWVQWRNVRGYEVLK
jgi:hypothetical protein